MMWRLTVEAEGVWLFQILGEAFRVMAEYNIIDHSTEEGCMYVVCRKEDPTKAVWTEDFIHAQDICKADYNNR